MHRGCFVWTPTPLLSGRRTPRLGPVGVCVCVPPLAGSGQPASRVRFGAPHLFLCPVLVRSLFARPPPGWGSPVCGCCCVFFSFSLSLSAALLSPAFRVLQPGLPWALASCGLPARPPYFVFFLFLCAPLLSLAFPVFRPGVPQALASCGPPARPPSFAFFFLFLRTRCLWRSVFSGPG